MSASVNSIHEQQNVTKRGIQTVVIQCEVKYTAVPSVINDHTILLWCTKSKASCISLLKKKSCKNLTLSHRLPSYLHQPVVEHHFENSPLHCLLLEEEVGTCQDSQSCQEDPHQCSHLYE